MKSLAPFGRRLNLMLRRTLQKRFVWAIGLSLMGMLPLEGQVIWTGNTSTDWNTGSNWNTGSVPSNTSTIIINSATGNQPQGGPANIGNFNGTVAQSGNLTISNGAQLTNVGTTQLWSGTITVDGVGSAWYGRDMIIGRFGTGALVVSNGGYVSAQFFVALGANQGSGSILVTGVGSTFAFSTDGFIAAQFPGLSVENGGILQLDTANSTLNDASFAFANGTLQLVNNTLTTNSTFSTANNTIFTVDTNNLAATLSGQIGGAGGLNKIGAGTLTLNATNTFTGNTTISTGTILLANAGALQNSTLAYNTNGGTLSFGTLTSATLGGLSGNKNLALANNSSAAVTLSLGGSNLDATYSGNLSGNGSLTKVGTGTQTLTGNDSITGNIAVNNGTLNIANGSSLTSGRVAVGTQGSGNLTVANGANVTLNHDLLIVNGSLVVDGSNSTMLVHTIGLGISGTGSITVSNGGKLTDLGGDASQIGSNGASAANAIITVTGTNSTFFAQTLSTALGGSGNGNGGSFTLGWGQLNVANGGLATINGSGGLYVALNLSFANISTGGTLQIDGVGGIWGDGFLKFSGGTLQVINSSLTTTVSATLAANTATIFDTNGFGATLSGVLSGTGGLIKKGAGTLTLNATNTFTGNTTINVGTILLANAGALQNNTLVYNTNGGTLSFGTLTSASLGGLSGNKDLALANNSSAAVALTVGGGNGDTTYSGNLTGNASLIKIGSGNLVLTGSGNAPGNTTITNGTLTINGGNYNFGTSTNLTVGNGSGSNGTLRVQNGGTVTLVGGNVGLSSGSNGSIVVDGANATLNQGSGTLQIGGAGAANLTITNGGFFNGSANQLLSIGGNTGSAVVTVTGTNSVLNANALGLKQNGTLNITNGGMVTSGLPNMLAGNMTVDGTNSTLTSTGSFYISSLGGSGNSTLTITNGGTVHADISAPIGSGSWLATILVTGNNSLLYEGGGPGMSLQNGTLTVANGGTVKESGAAFSNSAQFNLNSGGTLQVGGTNGLSGGGVFNFAGGTIQVINSNLTSTIAATLAVNTTTSINTNSLNATLSGGLGGSGGIAKDGAGTLTLNATNTYTGNTTINTGTLLLANVGALQNSTLVYNSSGGTLSFGSLTNATLGGLSGNKDLALANISSGAVALTIGGNNLDATYSGNLTGAGALIKMGTGNLTLSSNSSNLGTTSINAGTLIFAGAHGLPGGDIINNSTVIFSQTADTTLAGLVSGNGTLTQNGTANLTLANANTYTGNTNLLGGTLILGNTLALQNSTLNDNAGGNLSFGTLTNASLGGLSGNKDIALSTAANISVNLTVGANNASTTFSGNLSDNQAGPNFSSLTKVGAGTLTLAGVLSYQGSTTVSAGTLILNGSIGTSFANQVPGLTVGNGSLIIQNGSNLTVRGFKVGAASATNSTALITGNTTKVGSTEASITGLTVGYDGTGNLTIANGANVTVSNVDMGSLAAGNGTLLVTDPTTKLVYIGGSGNPDILTAGNNGTATLSIANGAQVTGNQGVLGNFSSGNGSVTVTGANSTWLVANLVVVGANGSGSLSTSNGGLVNITGADQLANITSLSLGSGNGSTGTGLVTGAGSQWTMAGALIVGSNGTANLTITNGGTVAVNGNNLTLAANASANGTLNLNSNGTLKIGGSNGIQAGAGNYAFNLAGGTLQVTGADLTTAINATLASSTNTTLNTNGFNATWSGAWSGNGSLTKIGAGTLSLTGNQNYSGPAIVNAGTLTLDNTVLNPGNAVSIKVNNGTLNIQNNSSLTSGAFLVDVGWMVGSNATALITGTNTIITASSGFLSVGDLGIGNLTIANGANLAVPIVQLGVAANSSGTLLVTGPGTILTTTSLGHSLTVGQAGSGTLTIANGASVSTNSTYISVQAGHGNVSISGPNSTLTLSDTLQVNGGGNLVIANGGNVSAQSAAVSGSFVPTVLNATANISGASSIWNTTGNLTLNANGTVTQTSGLVNVGGALIFGVGNGRYNLQGGTLQLGNANGIQASSGNSVFNWAGGTLQVTGANLTTSVNALLANNTTEVLDSNGLNAAWSGILSGNGTLTKTGAGNLTLAGNNTYTGNTTVNAGALVFTGDTSFFASDVLNNSSVVFSPGANTTFSRAISGNGAVTVSGPSAVILSGNNSYTGGTLISGGTLQVSNNGTASATGTGAINITANGTLAGSGKVGGNTTVNGTLMSGSNGTAGGLLFTQNLTLGANATTIFQLGGALRASQYSTVAVNGSLSLGGTLVISLFNSYLPALGVTFDLFQITSSVAGTFANYNLAPLGLNIGWNTSQLTTTGDISTTTINFAQWTTAAGLSGNNALPSAKPFKGQANAIRYAMNLDLSGAPAGAPSLSMINDSGTNYLVIQYRVRKNMTEYQLVPQYSPDMVSWTNVPAGNIDQLLDADTYTARYQASMVYPAHGPLFLRVVAQAVP